MMQGKGHKKQGRMRRFFFGALAVLFLFVPASAKACEMPWTANMQMNMLAQRDVYNMNLLLIQEGNYIDAKIGTAADEVKIRLQQLDENIRGWLVHWWNDGNENANYNSADGLKISLWKMARQLSFAKIDQTMRMGMLIDAQMFNEYVNTLQVRDAESVRRFKPSELTCQMDSVSGGVVAGGVTPPPGGAGPTSAFVFSRALNAALPKDTLAGTAIDVNGTPVPQPSRLNRIDSPSAAGRGAEIRLLWDEYVRYFCDTREGNQGCQGHTETSLGTSGIFPQTAETMPHVTDIAGLLWGDRQTIDMDNGGNQLFVQAAQRFLISPLSADPIARDATSASPGQESWLLRRSHETRVNAIYNVIGRMVSERAGRARPNADVTSDIRSAAGIDLTNVSSDPSYREIQQALSKERFYNPEYISSLVDDPSAVVREQGAINAIRLQQLNDMYQRMEEMVFMQAAVYAADLDRQVPPDATEEIEKK